MSLSAGGTQPFCEHVDVDHHALSSSSTVWRLSIEKRARWPAAARDVVRVKQVENAFMKISIIEFVTHSCATAAPSKQARGEREGRGLAANEGTQTSGGRLGCSGKNGSYNGAGAEAHTLKSGNTPDSITSGRTET